MLSGLSFGQDQVMDFLSSNQRYFLVKNSTQGVVKLSLLK